MVASCVFRCRLRAHLAAASLPYRQEAQPIPRRRLGPILWGRLGTARQSSVRKYYQTSQQEDTQVVQQFEHGGDVRIWQKSRKPNDAENLAKADF
jgi:hypothetical protein